MLAERLAYSVRGGAPCLASIYSLSGIGRCGDQREQGRVGGWVRLGEVQRMLHVDRAWAAIRHRPVRPWSSSFRLFVPINDELAVPLESSKARLKGSQHGYRNLGITTFLKRPSNNVALASDAFLALDDEAFNLR
jgi:hypothetical protein